MSKPTVVTGPPTGQHSELQKAFAGFMRALRHKEPTIREAAVEQLKTRAMPQVREFVLHRLIAEARDRDERRRERGIGLLRQIGSLAVEHLKLELAFAKRPLARASYIELLGEISPRHDPLVVLLLHDRLHIEGEHPLVRDAAKRALKRVWPELDLTATTSEPVEQSGSSEGFAESLQSMVSRLDQPLLPDREID
jgi:hypothetical protein